MFSETEMFLSDQFLSTCWKCCCFWTPVSWCSPAQPPTGPSELAWIQVLLVREGEQRALAGKWHLDLGCVYMCKWCWDRGISAFVLLSPRVPGLRAGTAMNRACALFRREGNFQWGHFSRKNNQGIAGNQGLLNTGTLSEAKDHHLSSCLRALGFI